MGYTFWPSKEARRWHAMEGALCYGRTYAVCHPVDDFLEEFNRKRPHEALAMKCPAEVYVPSPKPYLGIPEPHYPFHDRTVVVTGCGRLCLYRKKINLSKSLAGQAVGVKEVDQGIWLVRFMDYDLGYLDLEERTLQPLENPFRPKSVTYVLGTTCYPCLRSGHCVLWSGGRDFEPGTSCTPIGTNQSLTGMPL